MDKVISTYASLDGHEVRTNIETGNDCPLMHA